MIGLMLYMQIQTVIPQVGLASVYHPENEALACSPKQYSKKYPICANREYPCGTILNVQRQDNGKITQCVVADRGPYGACIQSKYKNKKTRACGEGKKWINAGKLIRKNIYVDPSIWRGILDLSPLAAKRLGFKNRLIKVSIWEYGKIKKIDECANIDDIDDPKIYEQKCGNKINDAILLEEEIAQK